MWVFLAPAAAPPPAARSVPAMSSKVIHPWTSSTLLGGDDEDADAPISPVVPRSADAFAQLVREDLIAVGELVAILLKHLSKIEAVQEWIVVWQHDLTAMMLSFPHVTEQ